MNKKIILDASALLALLNQEPGGDHIETLLPNAIMSSVNVSEVVSVLIELGISVKEAEKTVHSLLREIIPFDFEQAVIAASFRKITKQYGLSLGDRACLALGSIQNAPIYTADKVWSKLVSNLDIHIIR